MTRKVVVGCQKKDWARHKQLCIPYEPINKRSIEVHEAYTVDWNHIGGDLKAMSTQEPAAQEPLVREDDLQLSFTAEIQACLEDMGEIKKQPRAPNGLSQLRQLRECEIFLRSAMNMDTISNTISRESSELLKKQLFVKLQRRLKLAQRCSKGNGRTKYFVWICFSLNFSLLTPPLLLDHHLLSQDMHIN